MAPKKMPSRRMPASRKQGRAIDKVLREGTFTTTDPQGQINVLRQYQDAGYVPPQYSTPREVSDAVIKEMANGNSKREALAKLGIKLSPSFFDKKGILIGRQFRNAQSPALVEAWNQRTEGLTAQQLSKLEAAEWADLQKYYQEVGRRLGMKLDIGHFQTSASGAPGNVAAAGGEYAKANQAAGRSAENPPRPQTRYEELNTGMATNKVEGLSEAANLASDLPTRGGLRGSPLNPFISVLLGTNLKGQSSRFLPESNLEALNFEFDRLEKKEGLNPVAMYDYILERAGENINIDDMAKAGLEEYDISKFAPNVSNAKAGPLRTVQPANKVGTTEGVPKGLMPKGITPTPTPTQLTNILTPSQSLGQRAAAIANREPLPQPKPQPAAKMASTRSQQTQEAARRARLQGAELSKINMKGKSLKEMGVAIREAKARADAAYSAGKDVAPKPTAKPPQGRDKIKLEQKLRRSEEKDKQASRLKTAKAQAEPKPTAKPAASKPNVMPKPTAKPAASTTSRRVNRTGRRGQGSTRGVSARSTIETRDSRPLSAFNRGSAAYGGIEKQANDYVQDLPGYSPFLLRLAD